MSKNSSCCAIILDSYDESSETQGYQRNESCGFFPTTLNTISPQMSKKIISRDKPKAQDASQRKISLSLHFPAPTTIGKSGQMMGSSPFATMNGPKFEMVQAHSLNPKSYTYTVKWERWFLDG